MNPRLSLLAVALVAVLPLVSCTALHERTDAEPAKPGIPAKKPAQRTILALGGSGTHAKVKYYPSGLVESDIFSWDNRESFKDATRVPIAKAVYGFGQKAVGEAGDYVRKLNQ